MGINKKIKHISLDRVLPVYAVSTVVVSLEKRERANMFMVQDLDRQRFNKVCACCAQ